MRNEGLGMEIINTQPRDHLDATPPLQRGEDARKLWVWFSKALLKLLTRGCVWTTGPGAY